MAKATGRIGKTPHVSADEALRRHKLMDEAILRFRGGLDELEGALGMYMIGRHFGWKVIYLIHTKKTVAKYEKFLGIVVRDEFEAETIDSHRNLGFQAASALSNFWKVVSGDDKLPIDRAQRRSLD